MLVIVLAGIVEYWVETTVLAGLVETSVVVPGGIVVVAVI